MSAALAALLAAATLAATPQESGMLVASALPLDALLAANPLDPFADLAFAALPPPPATVVRKTHYYGTVTIDHRAHLARRAGCKTCHGAGSITKLEFTPRVAHQRCIGCHEQVARGPTKCAGCHVKTPEPPVVLLAAAAPAPAVPAPPEPVASNVAAALAAIDAPPPTPGDGGGWMNGWFGREPFHGWLEVGFAAGRGPGVSFRLASHQDQIVFTQGIDRIASGSEARTMGLLGAGLSRPLNGRFRLEVLALGGFDVIDKPVVALHPALGLRTGLEWKPPIRFLQQVTTSVSTVVDVGAHGPREPGRVSLYGTISTGFGLP